MALTKLSPAMIHVVLKHKELNPSAPWALFCLNISLEFVEHGELPLVMFSNTAKKGLKRVWFIQVLKVFHRSLSNGLQLFYVVSIVIFKACYPVCNPFGFD